MVIWIPCNPPTSWGKNSKSAFNVGGKPRVVESAQVKSTKGWLSALVAKDAPSVPLDGVLSLTVRVHFPHNKKTLKAGKGEIVPHTISPDLDNILATVQDVLQTMRFMVNDSRIAALDAKKFYSKDPGIFIKLEAL